MRPLCGVFFCVLAAALAISAPPAADQPGPLLKPVNATGSSVRVRIPVIEARLTTMQFKAQIPKPKGKKGEMIDVSVGIETLPGPSYISSKLWKSWGNEVPVNKTAAINDLLIFGSQIAPRTSKGQDVQVKMPAIHLEIIDPPGGDEKVRGCDIYLTLRELTKGADRTYETRLYFQDKYFELTVPSSSVKRPGNGEETPADPTVTTDPGLTVFASPMTGPAINRGMPLYTYSSVNGLTQYKTAAGGVEQVKVGVSSTNDWPTGVLMTIGTARGCKVEMEPDTDMKGLGATFETRVIKGKVKELRLGAMTGPGLKLAKDIVIQDLTVYVDKNDSGHFVWLGPRFLDAYFKDSLYACGTDGVWQLFGRLNPDLLQDIKTRAKK